MRDRMALGPVPLAFLALGVLALIAIGASLADARRFRRKVVESLRWSWTGYGPRVLLIVPVRGGDAQLEGNVAAMLRQEGVAHRTVFVVDDLGDSAVPALRASIAAAPSASAAIVASPSRVGYSGKASALLRGLGERTGSDEVIAFADADVRPHPRWLRTLVQPLADPGVGIATTYRWYVPRTNAMPSVARSAWNSVGLNIFFEDRYNFAWGGSNAVRAGTIDAIDVEGRWRGTLSEDLSMTDAIKSGGRTVAFVPAAIAPTFEDCSWRELRDWSTRQTAMVAVWGRHIGRYAGVMYALFNGITVLGAISLVLGLAVDSIFLVSAAMFLSNLPATAAKNRHRAQSVFLASPSLRAAWTVPPWKFALASLLVPWLVAYNLVRASRLRDVEWRGRTYRIEDGLIAPGGPPPGRGG